MPRSVCCGSDARRSSPGVCLDGFVTGTIMRALSTGATQAGVAASGRTRMKITALETLQLAEFPFLFWLRVHTDAGIVGTGETLLGAGAGRGLHPRQRRALPDRQGPARHRAARPHARQRLCRRARLRRRGARQLGGQHRALGHLRAGARRAALAAARRAHARRACRSTTPAPATGMSARPSATRCSSAPRTGR